MSQVSEAIKISSNETEKASLENLKCDLQEILDLTRETLIEWRGTQNACEETKEEEDPFTQEMAILMAEINNGETSKAMENTKNQTPTEVDKFKVKQLIHQYSFCAGVNVVQTY